MYPNQTRDPPPPPIIITGGEINTNRHKGMKQGGWCQDSQSKRKIIRSKVIKTDYDTFQSPLLNLNPPDKTVLGRYLPISISHEPRKFLRKRIF